MMKKETTKEMSGQEQTSKNKSTLPKKIRCVRECDMPGIGLFHADQIIEDQRLVALIGDNPNFVVEEA